MTLQQWLAFGVVGAMMALFVWGRLRFDVVALLTLLVSVAVGIGRRQENTVLKYRYVEAAAAFPTLTAL